MHRTRMQIFLVVENQGERKRIREDYNDCGFVETIGHEGMRAYYIKICSIFPALN